MRIPSFRHKILIYNSSSIICHRCQVLDTILTNISETRARCKVKDNQSLRSFPSEGSSWWMLSSAAANYKGSNAHQSEGNESPLFPLLPLESGARICIRARVTQASKVGKPNGRGLRWVAAVDNGPCIGTKRGRLSWAQYDLRKVLDSLSSEEKRRKRIFARETRGRE